MGRLRFGLSASIIVTIFLSLFLPACGGHKPPGASPLPLRITLNPAVSFSLQVGATIQLTATAVNAANSAITPTFTFTSTNPGIVDVAPSGAVCAGSWNAPLYSICTPAGTGTASVTASALGATSPPTLFFVHPPIDNIVVSVVPPVNSPPPACPTQQALPIACDLPFNRNAANFCLSQNQVQTLQARAYSQGVEITGSVGPFTWTEVNSAVATITPIVTTSDNVATNQATAVPGVPGQTQVIATGAGVSSQPYYFETCPVQCIDLEVGVNGTQASGTTNFVVGKGTSETITATAVDVQGCTVPKPPLTWVSSSPAALAAGGTTGCGPGTTCAITTTLAGAATITASCSPPTCNIGFPLNPAALQPPYIPQPVYPVSAISGLVTPAASSSGSGSNTTSTSVLVTSQDCVSNAQCEVGIYNVATSTNLPGRPSELPAPPNSLIFDPAGDRAYMGSEFGAVAITPANIGGTTSPFASLPAPSTPLGLVTGKVIGVSQNGSTAIFSDTVSTPNQVYVVNVSSSAAASTVALNINNATAATFSPDGLKVFILGNGGNSLYVYSSLQALQAPVSLVTPATAIAFNSTGSFALLSGGGAAGTFAAYNTCDNSAVPALSAGTVPGPPIFLKMVPAGNVAPGNTTIFGNPPVTLNPTGLDIFFGVDNTGIDLIATSSSQPVPGGSSSLAPLCPQGITLAQIQTTPPVMPPTPPTLFPPIHIPIGQGTFHPINFFLSPDTTKAYIVANDRSSVLVYNFATNATSGIALVNNATPVAADITPDGTLIYVAGTDGLLHQLNTTLALDQNQVSFQPLANSTNSFCFTGTNCQMNIVAVRP